MLIEFTHHWVSTIATSSRMLLETWDLQYDERKAKSMPNVSEVMIGYAMEELEPKGQTMDEN